MNGRRRCHRRLVKEYRNFQASPVENCSAAPLEDNIQEWHANIVSPLPQMMGTAFHFVIEFPDSYPNRAPKIRNSTYINHNNVFGDYICLDILTMSEETEKTPYRGWSSAYTVSSLLVQLQSFLFENNASKWSRDEMFSDAQQLVCSCGHAPKRGVIHPEITTHIESSLTRPGVYKALDQLTIRETIELNSAQKGHVHMDELVTVDRVEGRRAHFERGWVSLYCQDGLLMEFVSELEVEEDEEAAPERLFKEFYLSEMFEVVQRDIFSFCDLDTLAALQLVDDEFRDTIERSKDLMLRQFRCFYTLRELNDDPDLILGFGARKAIMDKRSRKTKQKFSYLQQLHPSFDFMSWEAYDKHNVRTNVWKDCDELDAFIPLYIHQEHGARALPLAEKLFKDLYERPSFTPILALNALSKLMNTTVVNMMKSVDDLESGELQMVDSIKALEGYMSFHHLLLAFAHQYPCLVEIANGNIKRFIEDPLCRDKEVTPDMGELLCTLAISEYTWEDFLPAWLQEGFQRNARWILAKFPNLLTQENEFSCIRLHQSYRAVRTGLRLAMFQRFFMKEIASPPELEGTTGKLATLLRQYNRRFGKPARGMAEQLQDHSRMVLDCDNWFNYFELMGFAAPTAEMVWKWLVNSARLSAARKYHQDWQILRYDENHLEDPNYILHLDTRHCMCASGKVFRIDPETNECHKDEDTTATLVEGTKKQLDLVFAIDCTGSMSSWIHIAKKEVKNIIRTICRKTSKKVRFGLVAYRDHDGEGYGKDKFIVRTHDFTNDLGSVYSNLSKLSAGGGADYPEAMCCALKECHDLSWNRQANQVIVLIGDAPPHGLVDSDSFPDGCPCGEDSLRNIHTMAQQGIAVYPVDCGGSWCAKRQSLFQAFARISGGCCVNLKDCKLLPEIVLGAALEESAMDELALEIRPILDQIQEHHNIAREEQVLYQVYTELKAKGVKVTTTLPCRKFDETIEHQIDSFAFCMDMQQARAIGNDDYFVPIPNSPFKMKSAKVETLVSRDQVKRALRRMQINIAEELVMNNGCQYRKDRWKLDETKLRWAEFRKRAPTLGKFKPWKDLTQSDMKQARIIPDRKKVEGPKVAASSGRMKSSRIISWGAKPAAKPAPEPVVEPSPVEPVVPSKVEAPREVIPAEAAVDETRKPEAVPVSTEPEAPKATLTIAEKLAAANRRSRSRSLEPVVRQPAIAPPQPPIAAPQPMVRNVSYEVQGPVIQRRSLSQHSNASAQLGVDVCLPYGTCTSLRVRAGQSIRSPLLGDVANGQIVRVAEIVGTRARIVKPVHGWIATHDNLNRALIVPLQASNLERGEAYGTRTALRVRAGHAINTAWVADIASGQVVRVAEIQGNRARIVKPVRGWICTKNNHNQDLIVKIAANQIARSSSNQRSATPQRRSATPQPRHSRSSSLNRTPVHPQRPPLQTRAANSRSSTPSKSVTVTPGPTVLVENLVPSLTENDVKQRFGLRGIKVKTVQILRRGATNSGVMTFHSHTAANMAVSNNGMKIEGRLLAIRWDDNYIATRRRRV